MVMSTSKHLHRHVVDENGCDDDVHPNPNDSTSTTDITKKNRDVDPQPPPPPPPSLQQTCAASLGSERRSLMSLSITSTATPTPQTSRCTSSAEQDTPTTTTSTTPSSVSYAHFALDDTRRLHIVAPQRSLWVPDSERPRCARCRAEFTFWLRRHHCRQCGDVYCASCCPAPHSRAEERTCMTCTATSWAVGRLSLPPSSASSALFPTGGGGAVVALSQAVVEGGEWVAVEKTPRVSVPRSPEEGFQSPTPSDDDENNFAAGNDVKPIDNNLDLGVSLGGGHS